MSLRILTCLSLLAACGSGATSQVEDRPPAEERPSVEAPAAPPSPAAPPGPAPRPVPRGSISAGPEHVCATVAGRVACWGRAGEGQLGPSIHADQPRPVLLEGLVDIAGVAAGSHGSCAWSERGAVWCWGTPPQPRAARVAGIDDAVQVVVDGGLACALRRGGRVACWSTAYCSPERAGGAAPARLRRTDDPPPELACGLHEIRSIEGATELAIAGHHACALSPSEIRCWKGNSGPPFALPGSAGATSIAGARQPMPARVEAPSERHLYGSGLVSYENLFALAGDALVGWTLSAKPERVHVRAVHPGASRIAAAGGEVCVIGSAVSCTSYAHLRRDHALAAVDLAVGRAVACARTTDDRLACWGSTALIGDGRLDPVDKPVEVAGISDATQLAGGYHTACVRRANGRVACWGTSFDGEVDTVPTDAGVDRAVDLVVGHGHACAIRGDGTTACWGRRLASSSFEPIPPTLIPALAGAHRLSADASSTCAIRAGQRVACDGSPYHSKLPDRATELWYSGDTSCRRRPDRTVACESAIAGTAAELGGDVLRISIGHRNVCAVRAGGAVDCHGDSLRAPPRRISDLHDAIAIATAGMDDRTCAVRAAGTVACWNEDARDRGPPVPVPDLTGAIDIAVGGDYACALRRDGRVSCWGGADHLGNGSRSRRESPVLLPALPRPRP